MKAVGYPAVFNRRTEINGKREGRYLEQIAPGAFAKTITEDRSSIRALYEHGGDPVIGTKPLGVVEDLHEDSHGAGTRLISSTRATTATSSRC